ncbi:hypothetical protein BJV77DRAFT_374221 [Russula vinacea]|nr:hypothetical protein BJV77DRAFT_374221 [Russula vinacea]
MPLQPQPQSPYKSNSVRSYPPQPALNQTAPLSHSSDTSVPLLTLYLRTAEEHDGRRRKLLKGDTDQILVFVSPCICYHSRQILIFSGKSSVVCSPPQLQHWSCRRSRILQVQVQPRPGAILSTECGHSTSANLFWAIQSIIDTNQSASAAAAAISAIIAAGLSRRRQLVLALELATQYFMRSSRIIATTVGRATYGDQFVARQSTGARRLRTLFAAGIERLNLTFLVEVLHCLMHIAFSIFLVGLLLYLFMLILHLPSRGGSDCAFIYGICMVNRHSNHSTRLSILYTFTNILAVTYAGVLYGTPRLLYLIKSLIHANMVTQGAVRYPEGRFRDWYLSSMKFKMAQELAPLLDSDVLKRTLDMLRSDDDLEQFFEAIPGFFASEIVQNPRGSLALLSQPLAEALVQFWNRTLSSDRVSESVKGRRLIICMRVIEAADLSIAVPRSFNFFLENLLESHDQSK